MTLFSTDDVTFEIGFLAGLKCSCLIFRFHIQACCNALDTFNVKNLRFSAFFYCEISKVTIIQCYKVDNMCCDGQ